MLRGIEGGANKIGVTQEALACLLNEETILGVVRML